MKHITNSTLSKEHRKVFKMLFLESIGLHESKNVLFILKLLFEYCTGFFFKKNSFKENICLIAILNG